ncbi:hypothetical protein GCM10009835_04860 [Planosporangium flavigriseum]|uniref:Uncharacterized protein n=1 Tax=Planosporangium flavigriseum TaxID=373681 RepID=A0A8J3PKU1_9ACTN|nr:hypothetical protein Pfl04_15760 [Planosporangium flavigriseum]
MPGVRQVTAFGQFIGRTAAVEHPPPHLRDLLRVERVDPEVGRRPVQQRLPVAGEPDQGVTRVEQHGLELTHVRASFALIIISGSLRVNGEQDEWGINSGWAD